MRKTLVTITLVAVAVSSTATAMVPRGLPMREGKPCARPNDKPVLFTVKMGERAIQAYVVNKSNVIMLNRIIRCQRNPQASRFLKTQLKQAKESENYKNWPQGDTSWYYDGGTTGCGFHVYYGVANKYLPCGTKVKFHYRGREVTAEVDDRGPYVGDRIWDLNQNTAAALGFEGVHFVYYKIGG